MISRTLPMALFVLCALVPMLLAAEEPAWTPVCEGEQWYKDNAAAEKIFTGTLEAVTPPPASTLMRPAYYKLGDRTIFTGGKKIDALDALVGKKVDLRGKPNDIELEGQSVKEIWPGAIRPAQ